MNWEFMGHFDIPGGEVACQFIHKERIYILVKFPEQPGRHYAYRLNIDEENKQVSVEK